MDYLPVFLSVRNQRVLVIGGGSVAARKVELLLRCGARVHVVAPRLGSELTTLVEYGAIDWDARVFHPDDLDGAWLVYVASDDRELQQRVSRLAEHQRIPVNVVDRIEECRFITPALVDRTPVTVAFSTGGASPVLARRLRERLEAWLPQSTGRFADFVRDVRTRIAERLPDFQHRRGFHEWLVDGPVAHLFASDRDQEARERFETALTGGGPKAEGRVSLVGAGPGDPDLLTLKALRRLQQADVIVHDQLVDRRILDFARRDAELIDMGKRAGDPGHDQAMIHRLLAERAGAGEAVVRLKGGDPFVFGRGGEELDFLRDHGIAFEVVPGITAAVGCAAYAGLPLTHRDHARSLSLVTGHCRDGEGRPDWEELAQSHHTLVLYMAVRRIAEIENRLIRHGRHPDTPFAFVENGCRPEQRVIVGRLGNMSRLADEQALASPALLYIGEVAELAAGNHWYGAVPVDGCAVAYGGDVAAI